MAKHTKKILSNLVLLFCFSFGYSQFGFPGGGGGGNTYVISGPSPVYNGSTRNYSLNHGNSITSATWGISNLYGSVVSSTSTSASISFTAAGSTSVSAFIQDNLANIHFVTKNVTIQAGLSPGTISGPQTICYLGNPANISNTSSASGGGGGYVYQWQDSPGGGTIWNNINGATSTSYNPPGGFTVSKWYRRKVTSGILVNYTSSVKITVKAPLNGGSINGTQTVCYAGNPNTLGNAASPYNGVGGYTYQWQYSNNGNGGWSNIGGATSSTYNPPNGLTSNRWYRRKVVSCGQTKYTNVIKVTVDPGQTYYADTDGDGYGDPGSSTIACSHPQGYVTNSADHDDSTVLITNIAPQLYYSDSDGDGIGDGNSTIFASFKILGYANTTGDPCPDIPGLGDGCDAQTVLPSNENYVHKKSFQDMEGTTAIEQVTYYDGLGRPMQHVEVGASGTGAINIAANAPAGWTMDWNIGSGSTGFFNQNGVTTENKRITAPGPFGKPQVIWSCGNDPSSSADGGWNTDYFAVDKTKAYRYTVWVNRFHSNDGKTYHGTQNVDNLGGGANGNPYFWSGDLPQLEEWYLLVGVVHPFDHGGGDIGVSGVYDMQGNRIVDGTEFKWRNDTTTSRFRSYLYYSTDVNVRQYFHAPTLEVMDGTEVPLRSILGNGRANDLITHIDYDEYGRKEKEWLPHVPDTGVRGSYRGGDMAMSTKEYYLSAYPMDFPSMSVNEVNAYSQSGFEASPLNRLLKQAAPGKDWKMGNGHEIEFGYLTNFANEVRLYRVDINFANGIYEPTLVANGHYNSGTLYKNVNYDENHDGTPSKLHTTEAFTDKLGRTVLKRTYVLVGGQEEAHDTHYVYDDYGNLTYVLPPKVDTANGVSATELTELCYQYKYDHRNRLVEKKVPGKGWEHIVYNRLDWPIMTQDANLRINDQWLFTKYDAHGRVAYTGLHTQPGATDRATMQGYADDTISYGQYETKQGSSGTIAGTTIYYSNDTFPQGIMELYKINYYDNYVFDRPGLSLPVSVLGTNTSLQVTGLATGSKVRILGTNDWTTTMLGYDDQGRSIWTKSINDYLGSTDVTETRLDFVGRPLQTRNIHARDGHDPITTDNDYEYDDMGRLMGREQEIGLQETLLVNNTYDELGQLVAKKVGGNLQTVDYRYNVRGWLKAINNTANLGNDLFAFDINYNTADHGGTPLYNGNIAETEWRTANTDNGLKWYRYGYDPLNRIINATANSPNYHLNSVGYDKNGNILSLQRQGHTNADATLFGNMDDLVYTYDSGNKLIKVLDNGNDSQGFNDGTDIATEYVYDQNGNMTIDLNKGIRGATTTDPGIVYNHLDLPESISVNGNGNNGTISYIYDATGRKLKKIVSTGNTTEYAGNYVYENGQLQFFGHPEGYVVPDGQGGYDYVYQYRDHLGNIRLSYQDINEDGSVDSSEILQERNYYPFGLEHKGYNNSINGVENNYMTYQGKELDESLGLDWHDFGARQYDASIGRWLTIDPLAEQTGYAYAAMNNNPVAMIDPTGMSAFWVPKLNEDGSTSYIAEEGDTVETFQSQYGLEDGQAEAIIGNQEIVAGETEISGEQVKQVTESDVLQLDLASDQAKGKKGEQRIFDQFVFAGDIAASKGEDRFFSGDFFSNLQTIKTGQGGGTISGTASMTTGGQTFDVLFDLVLTGSNGIGKSRPTLFTNTFTESALQRGTPLSNTKPTTLLQFRTFKDRNGFNRPSAPSEIGALGDFGPLLNRRLNRRQ
ncbi:hypothetical protein HME9304_02131 [Flagellimonas maritima]|uniref:DUF6443 domain-containing protein n=1 Tax=Flagellimonas maritima TaxID=1383885 RepID=A0A2Z4LT52_9FLAO|nr:DUF6443 domain-containing protein [Allomuricauda aurantiaca]AWX45121.1 hypothetical protein HME9304_02131 [Allomuricauda aurantiaca]